MSQETLKLANEVLAALSRGDFDRLIALTDPEVEWHSFFAELGEDGFYRGLEGMLRYREDLAESWEIVRTEIDDGIEIGNVAVLVGRIHYQGRMSGIEDSTPAGWMLKFRHGKVVRFRAFREPERVLEMATLARGPAANFDN
jgi:ketosteroid isomerase-like protein